MRSLALSIASPLEMLPPTLQSFMHSVSRAMGTGARTAMCRVASERRRKGGRLVLRPIAHVRVGVPGARRDDEHLLVELQRHRPVNLARPASARTASVPAAVLS